MKVEIGERGGFKLVRTTETIGEAELVLDLSVGGEVCEAPTRTSIVIAPNRHAEHPVGAFINHSCDPSCAVLGQHLVTLFELPAGTEITFVYTENEGPLASPFTCQDCGEMVVGPPAPCKR